jgi:hypothetical protein
MEEKISVTSTKINHPLMRVVKHAPLSKDFSSRLHAYWTLLLIWLIPPYGWYNIWKHKKYHVWFALLLWLDSFLVLLPSVVYRTLTYPRLMQFYHQSPVSLEVISLLIAFSLSQFGYGILLFREIKYTRGLPKKFLWPTVIIYASDYILTSIITPIAFPLLNNPIIEILKHLVR